MEKHNKHMDIPKSFRQDKIMGSFVTNINNTKIDLNYSNNRPNNHQHDQLHDERIRWQNIKNAQMVKMDEQHKQTNKTKPLQPSTAVVLQSQRQQQATE
jgi:hypothetical protein